MRRNLLGKEGENCTNIKVFMIDFEAGHTTDPPDQAHLFETAFAGYFAFGQGMPCFA
ncbi:hypothetical protein AALA80_10950 [Oscillospiraceae bacterium 50-60]